MSKNELKQFVEDLGDIEKISGDEEKAEYRFTWKVDGKIISPYIKFAKIEESGRWNE